MNPISSLPQPAIAQIQSLPVAYTEVDAQGILRVVNEAACHLHRMSSQDLIGHSIWEFVPHDEAVNDRTEFLAVIAAGEDPPPVRRSLYTARGGYRTHELHRRLLRDDEGRAVGIACVTFDVSQLEAANREARQDKLWLQSALTAIPQAVVVTDALGFVRYINSSAERLTGWPTSQILGQQFEKRMPILRATSKSQKPLSFRITLEEPWNGDVELLTRDRETVSVWLSASPILDQETHSTQGVVIVLGSPRTVAK